MRCLVWGNITLTVEVTEPGRAPSMDDIKASLLLRYTKGR